MVFASTLFSFAALAATMVSAHPHVEPGSVEALKRAEFQNIARASLASCQDTLAKRGGLYDRAIARRDVLAQKARRRRSLPAAAPYKRSLDDVVATDHESNLTSVTNNTDIYTLLGGNSTCVLQAEVTEGPYYVDGEYVRWDIREDQGGVDTYIDVQLVDVDTCEPVSDVYIDLWHANATGVYSGVVASGNGNGDESNINSTFLRGIQVTDDEGVAQWLTVFPGHYDGRTTHIHIVAHNGGTVYSNGTYKSDTVAHVGQLFLDQSLISTVEEESPYSTNTQNTTLNSDDSIMSEEAADSDPVLNYVFLGDAVTDGILAWAAVGINTTLSKTITAAATLTEDGGVANEDSMSGGGGPGGAPDNSSMPANASSSASAAASSSSSTASSSDSGAVMLAGSLLSSAATAALVFFTMYY